MSAALADGVLKVVQAAAQPMIDEIKSLRAKVDALEVQRASACDLAKRLETRVAQLEAALGVTP